MLELADRLGADKLATGHYARIAEPDHEHGPLLRVAADAAKDQTYMLAALSPASLARMTFPLGELEKPEVRRIAARAGLPVASKADSQDLCFLAGTSRARFLARHGALGDRPGTIVDSAGARRRPPPRPAPLHGRAAARDRHQPAASRCTCSTRTPNAERVTVGPRAALRTSRIAVRGARLHRRGSRVNQVKLRYRSRPLRATARRRA